MTLRAHPHAKLNGSGKLTCRAGCCYLGKPMRVSAVQCAEALLVGGMSPQNTGTLIVLTAIAGPESCGYHLNAVGDNGTSFGPWQEHTLPGKDQAAHSLTEAGRMAVEKYHMQGLGAWSTYKSGAYLPYMPRATVAVANAKRRWHKSRDAVGTHIDTIQSGRLKFFRDCRQQCRDSPNPGESFADCMKQCQGNQATLKQGTTPCIHEAHIGILLGHGPSVCLDGILGGAKVAGGGLLMGISGLAIVYLLSREIPGSQAAQRAVAKVTPTGPYLRRAPREIVAEGG